MTMFTLTSAPKCVFVLALKVRSETTLTPTWDTSTVSPILRGVVTTGRGDPTTVCLVDVDPARGVVDPPALLLKARVGDANDSSDPPALSAAGRRTIGWGTTFLA
eukprot:PhM_4_TR10617/c0_g1_i1/m.84301